MDTFIYLTEQMQLRLGVNSTFTLEIQKEYYTINISVKRREQIHSNQLVIDNTEYTTIEPAIIRAKIDYLISTIEESLETCPHCGRGLSESSDYKPTLES